MFPSGVLSIIRWNTGTEGKSDTKEASSGNTFLSVTVVHLMMVNMYDQNV